MRIPYDSGSQRATARRTISSRSPRYPRAGMLSFYYNEKQPEMFLAVVTRRAASPSSGPGRHRLRRPGQRLARQLLVAHRGVVGEHRGDRRLLHQVVALHAIVDVHVRVVRPRVVLEAILHELESRQADGVERRVIGRGDTPRAEDRDAQVL